MPHGVSSGEVRRDVQCGNETWANMTSICSLCPTFAAVGAFIHNARWDGVPFLLKAGKALHSKRAEIRVQFRHVPGNLYYDKLGVDLDRSTNELVRALFCCQFPPSSHVQGGAITFA